MSQQQNEALVSRMYAAFSAGDVAAMQEIFAPDIVWSSPGNSKISGEHKGQQALFALFGFCAEATQGRLQVLPESIEATGPNTVVSTHRVIAERPDGRKLDIGETEHITIENDRITGVEESYTDQAASDAFWS
jgi:ketosteroid isomerase-like protein